MGGLPYLKFYPTDWQADEGVQLLSLAARGLWFEMLCIMHKAEGYLRIGGRSMTPTTLARAVRCDLAECEALMAELEEAGVYSLADDGTPFSRRIVRDIERAEIARENGRKGGNPALRGGVNPPNGPTGPNGLTPGDNTHGTRARPHPDPSSESSSRRLDSDDDGKAAAAPERRAALPDDEGSLAQALRILVAEGHGIAVGHRRKIASAATASTVQNPIAFVRTSIANALKDREIPKPAAKVEPAKLADVWVRFGSAAWQAWDRVEPQPALETRYHPGEWGCYRTSEFPLSREAQA